MITLLYIGPSVLRFDGAPASISMTQAERKTFFLVKQTKSVPAL